MVGIPCFIKAVNLLRRHEPIIAERVTHTIGLFCGHMKSAQMVDSFAVQIGTEPEAVAAIDYRLKNPDRPANWYTAQLTLTDGSTRQQDWWHLVDGDWGSGFFMNSACNFCDDVVAETADIAMGDAWVEPYSSDGKGTNVVIARSPLMLELVQTGIAEGRLALSEVDHAFVSQTQAAGFRQRREGLAYRLTRARPAGAAGQASSTFRQPSGAAQADLPHASGDQPEQSPRVPLVPDASLASTLHRLGPRRPWCLSRPCLFARTAGQAGRSTDRSQGGRSGLERIAWPARRRSLRKDRRCRITLPTTGRASMRVSGIDHVNILTNDLEATASFYEQVLGLTRSENDAIGLGFRGAWMRDATGCAIVHLVWKDPASERYHGYDPGAATNAVHHIAFRCEGFEVTRDKLDGLGIEFRANDRKYGDVRQIFLTDPNAVNLELNFARD